MISPPFDPRADALLVSRALREDRAATQELVARLLVVVRAKVRAVLRAPNGTVDYDLADDISQDVWVHLVSDGARRLLAYDPERGLSLESYVAIVAEREAISRLRRITAQKRGGHLTAVEIDDLNAASAEPSPEEHLAEQQVATDLGRHLEGALPERGRLVWRYTFHDGRDPTEAARILGVEVQVIYNWQFKIRRLARNFLEQVKAAG